MALGKYSRVDSRRSSSSWCSTATLVVFVALFLVGVWMMTSSTVSPAEMSASEKSDINEEIPQNEDKAFEDGSGDAVEDVTKADKYKGSNTASEEKNADVYQGQDDSEKVSEIKEQETIQATPEKESEEKKEQKGQNFSDEDGRKEGDEKNEDSGEGNNQEQDNSLKQKSSETSRIEESSVVNESINDDKQNNENENSPSNEYGHDEKGQDQTESEQKVEETEIKEIEQDAGTNKTNDQSSVEMLPDPAQSELLNETSTQAGSWSTQATESKKEKEKQKSSSGSQISEFKWKLCGSTAGQDFIPCLDNQEAIAKLPSTKHYEHRERHCPEEGPTCLVPLPEGYKRPIKWPQSRDKVWYANVPHTKLAVVKGHQNWVKATGEYLTFPGGGTQFKHGALHYIDFIQESFPDIGWGKKTRVILDVGCGVASFGGFLFDRDVLAISFAPKDEHEAQVQFALERGIPAISAVMGTKRLPFPGRVFDVVHCARCRVPWHIEGGKLLLELNRLLRPGGYFVWSATPIYQDLKEDVEIWKAMTELTKSICWEMLSVTKDTLNGVGIAVYRKPTSNECYEKRMENNPPLCKDTDDPNAAWNVQLQSCMHRVPVDPSQRGSKWPEQWPKRVETGPYWLNSSQIGIYGQAAPEDFKTDYKHWKRVVSKSYLTGMGIDWTNVRNVMDMRAVYGGFAAALREMNVWVMNVVSIDSEDTLPIIYERGLFGIYHDWCESFSTYPRTYDLVHADHLFSKIKKRCKLLSVMAEVDRILRPEGTLIVRDDVETINELEDIAKSLHWGIRMTYSKDKEGLICAEKKMWRPQEVEASI